MRRWIAIWVTGVFLCLAGVAWADDAKTQAKQHFQSGEAKFKAGDYQGAVLEFEAADRLVPSPILSYNIALCYERLGDDERAIQYYRAYLTRRPDASNKDAVLERIAAAEQRVQARNEKKVPAPAPQPQPPAPQPQPPPPPQAKPEGPPAPAPQVEGPAPPGGQPAPSAPVDEAMVKRLPSRGGASPTPAPGADVLARGGGQAAPATPGEAEPAPVPAPPNDSGPQKKKAKPVYKEWWFWVVVGVSAIIVIDVLDSNGSDNAQPGATSGPILLRF